MSGLGEIIQRNVSAAIGVAFLLGVVLGLVVLGWQVWPVQWRDALPADLRADYQSTYLSMAADSYAQNGDAELALQRVVALTGGSRTTTRLGQELNALAQAQSTAGDTAGAGRLEALATLLGVEPGQLPSGPGGLPVSPRGPETATARFLRICGLVILVLVVLAGLLLLVYFLQSRTTAEPEVADRLSAATGNLEARAAAGEPAVMPPLSRPVPTAVAPAAEAVGAIGPFVATYNLGDIDFDMSFGIEAPNGDFLGECGLGMAETVGGGDTQRVTAFEVWLFDKTDIRTVSVVLASAHAHADAALRTKLASRGEIVLAQMGGEFSIKTSSLQLDGRVLDLAYGGGDVPAESYFTSFSVELVPVQLEGEQA